MTTGFYPPDWRELCQKLVEVVTESDDYILRERSTVDLVNRARAALAQPEPEPVGPTLAVDEQVPKAIDPIPLSERKPGLEDCHCITNSTARDGAYVWAGSIIQSVGLNSFWNWDFVDRDYMITHSSSGRGATLYTHWLPASVEVLPTRCCVPEVE